MPKSACPAPKLQRAFGELRVGFKQRDGSTVLATLAQAGCLRARLPRRAYADWAEAVVLNNAGGVASGDHLATIFELAATTRAVLTTASAERVYRRATGTEPAIIGNHITIGAGAAAEWLPQETILFDASALHRRLDVEMTSCASLLGIEAIVFGRQSMGETLHTATVRDLIRIRRDGRLILHDAWQPPAAFAATLRRVATGGSARAMATLLQISPAAGHAIDTVRAVLAGNDAVEAGASCWDGMLVVRLLSASPLALRGAAGAVLRVLRDGRMLPRTWNC